VGTSVKFRYPHFYLGYALVFSLASCQYVVMECILCGGNTKVTNSRPQTKLNKIWRRRECLKCGAVFTSSEQIDLSKSLLVKNSAGQLEPFITEKLLLSVYDSLKHRETALSDSMALTNTIVHRIFKTLSDSVISRDNVVKISSDVLKKFDRASFMHYTAYHPVAK
jgi:transcriptional repressor NrdR